MAIKSYKLGPGLFTLNPGAGALEVSSQVKSLTIKCAEKVTSTDPVPVLSGEELAGDESTSYEWSMTGTLVQDITVGGVGDYSWENKGIPTPFSFVPSTAAGRTCTGTVVPVPLDFGGEVTRTGAAETPLTWRIPTDPVLGSLP